MLSFNHADLRPVLQDHSSVGHSKLVTMHLGLSPESTTRKCVQKRNVSLLTLRQLTTRQSDIARPLGHRTCSIDGWRNSAR